MASRSWLLLAIAPLALVAFSGCKKDAPEPPSQIDSRACDTLSWVRTPDRFALDETVFCEGKGALRFTAEQPATFPLFEIPYPPAENADLLLKAKVRGQDLAGVVSLQLAVKFPSGGEVLVQGPAVCPTDWQEVQVTSPLPPGKKATAVGVNVIAEAMGGTVWIDDIRLIKIPK